MLKIQLNNSNHRRIEFTEKSSQSQTNKGIKIAGNIFAVFISFLNVIFIPIARTNTPPTAFNSDIACGFK